MFDMTNSGCSCAGDPAKGLANVVPAGRVRLCAAGERAWALRAGFSDKARRAGRDEEEMRGRGPAHDPGDAVGLLGWVHRGVRHSLEGAVQPALGGETRAVLAFGTRRIAGTAVVLRRCLGDAARGAHQYCPPQPNWSRRHWPWPWRLQLPMSEPVASPLKAYPLLFGLSVRRGCVAYSWNSAQQTAQNRRCVRERQNLPLTFSSIRRTGACDGVFSAASGRPMTRLAAAGCRRRRCRRLACALGRRLLTQWRILRTLEVDGEVRSVAEGFADAVKVLLERAAQRGHERALPEASGPLSVCPGDDNVQKQQSGPAGQPEKYDSLRAAHR